ncbi:TPA: hypothetical protein RFV68_001563 [Klebsiella variicola]|nr:hypothetical protein [Klebsiella variicola]
MTDITELAQREKFEAWWEREYKHLESSKYTDAVPHIKYGFWMAYQAGGAELVDALEKAQQVDEELCKLLPPGAEYMDPPDGGDVEPIEQVRRMVADYRLRIAELESRTVTVKLPDIMPPEAAPAHYWGSSESMAYADGYNKSAADLKTSFAQACSSAGVNVEFE